MSSYAYKYPGKLSSIIDVLEKVSESDRGANVKIISRKVQRRERNTGHANCIFSNL
jgi:hypothetical protein